tara:strand:- start:1143 stop:1361 length:219 start_codon:yes stop_codon:yes gene_type:complete
MIRLSNGMIWLKKPINIIIFTKKYVFLSFGGSQEAKNAQKQLLKPFFGKLRHIQESCKIPPPNVNFFFEGIP